MVCKTIQEKKLEYILTLLQLQDEYISLIEWFLIDTFKFKYIYITSFWDVKWDKVIGSLKGNWSVIN